MDPEVVRRQILGFIRAHFDRDTFESVFLRGDPYFATMSNYEDFLVNQVGILDNAPLAQLERYRIAMVDIQNRMYKTMDLEVGLSQPASGFYLENGRLVFLH